MRDNKYLTQINKIPKLSRAEEMELWRQWESNHDPKVRDAILRANIRYVSSIAFKYCRCVDDLGILISVGCFGIMKAFEKFNPDSGTRFVTYLGYWVRCYIQNYLTLQRSIVSDSGIIGHSSHFFKTRREYNAKLLLLGDHELAVQEVSKRLGIKPHKIQEILNRLDKNDISTETPVLDGDFTLGSVLIADGPDPEQQLQEATVYSGMLERASKALSCLDPRELTIVKRRLMADPEDVVSLSELGREFRVTRERVRQLEERAKKKLVRYITSNE
jgi:RNA polymerase sigma-32 factor